MSAVRKATYILSAVVLCLFCTTRANTEVIAQARTQVAAKGCYSLTNFAVTTDKSSYTQGETVSVNVSFTNKTNSYITLEYLGRIYEGNTQLQELRGSASAAPGLNAFELPNLFEVKHNRAEDYTIQVFIADSAAKCVLEDEVAFITRPIDCSSIGTLEIAIDTPSLTIGATITGIVKFVNKVNSFVEVEYSMKLYEDNNLLEEITGTTGMSPGINSFKLSDLFDNLYVDSGSVESYRIEVLTSSPVTGCIWEDQAVLPVLATNGITINTGKIVRPVNRSLFGVALEANCKEQWTKPLDFNDPELKDLITELAPTVISIDNSMLPGLPFYPENTGEYSKRLSIIKTLERMEITRNPIGTQIYTEVLKEPQYYDNPQHKNYDDLLQFIEGLSLDVDIAIRIPIIFTNQRENFRDMKLNIDPQTGADLVQYLNGPETTPLGRLRASNGHPEPYNVKHIVLGNELWSNHDFGGLGLEQIISQYNLFAEAMKQADPTVELGINLVDDAYPHEFFLPGISVYYSERIQYNDKILKEVADNIDFVTFHVYGGVSEELDLSAVQPTDEEWKYIMAQNYLKGKYSVAEKHRGIVDKYNPNLKIAVDEYCGPSTSLGGALYNAEYLIYMLHKDYMFATAWDMGIMFDKMFGLVRVDEVNGKLNFVKRPNYYSLKMFTRYFGDLIVESNVVDSSTFDTLGVANRYFNWPAETYIPSLTAIATTRGNKLYLMVINRELNNDLEESIRLIDFQPKKTAKVYTLSGPSINATNEKISNAVTIKETAINDASSLFKYNFSKHSITVIEFERMPEL